MFSNELESLASICRQALTARPTRTALACTSGLTPYPQIERELAALDGVQLDVTHVVTLAPGSLGHGCAAFWRENALQPLILNIPPEVSACRKLALRRLLLHDFLHVLLDFRADAAGELGVFSFVAAQRYCPQFEWSARDLAQLYMTMAPWMRGEFAEAEYRGRQLASRTPHLLTMPLELEWSTSLVLLRDRLNIRKARTLRGIADLPQPARALVDAH